MLAEGDGGFAQEGLTMSVRRLPVYLVLDCSGSMTGQPIEAVRQGVKALISDLQGDPMALETTFLSVITFASGAEVVTPLTDLCSFAEPILTAFGSTDLGAALNLLIADMQANVKKSTPEQKGDYRPLVFLMTDGQPTDAWEAAAQALRSAKPANVICCAAGPLADVACLQKISETVVQLDNLQPEQLRKLFRWVSSSIKVASVAASANDPSPALPAPPAGIKIVM
jgi:uncharacterized protein YegL